MKDDIKPNVSLETLFQVSDCHRQYGCLLEKMNDYDRDNALCNKLSEPMIVIIG